MTISNNELVVDSHGPDETLQIGRALGGACEPGLVVGLVGPLGAGKTHFVRGVAEGLHVSDSRVVSSPTFVLIQEYAGDLPIYHFDTYRLATAADFSDLGVDEYFEGDGVCLVEWADRVPQILPDDRLEITLEIRSELERVLRFVALGAIACRVLDRVRAALV